MQVAIGVLLTIATEQIFHGTSNTVVCGLRVRQGQELSQGHVGDADVTLILSATHLRRILISSTLTNEGNDVALLQAQLLEVALRTDAIDISLTRPVADVDITIFGLSHASDDTRQTILRISYFGSEEVGNAALNDSTLLRDGALRSVVLLAVAGAEGNGSLAVATLIRSSAENNLGIVATFQTYHAEPVGIFGQHTVDARLALAREISRNQTTLNRQRLGSAQRVDLDERLVDIDDGDVHQLDGTIVGRLRTLDRNLVAYLETPAAEVLGSALSVERAVDIDFASSIIQIPVAVSRIGNAGNRTRHAIGLRVGTCNDLGASSIRDRREALDDGDVLRLASTLDEQFHRATIKGLISREADFSLSGSTAGRSNGEPLRSSGYGRILACNPLLSSESPVRRCIDGDGSRTTILRNRYVRLRYAYLAEVGGVVIIGTACEHGCHNSHDRRNNIL